MRIADTWMLVFLVDGLVDRSIVLTPPLSLSQFGGYNRVQYWHVGCNRESAFRETYFL